MITPVFTMVLLTFCILVVAFLRRVRAVKTGAVRMSFYRVFQGAEMPVDVAASTRAFANQFEMPVLFYAAAILAMTRQYETDAMVMLAWAFVVLRVIHAGIHLTYNDVMHRLGVFMASNLCLLAMWVLLALKLM